MISDFEDLYEVVRAGVTTELAARQREAVERAGIETSKVHSLTEFTAAARQRIDEYVKLPFGSDGRKINFIIMKPWG